MNKMAAPIGQHGIYLFWLQLLNHLSDFHAVFTDGLSIRSSLRPDHEDWCHSSPLNKYFDCRFDGIVYQLVRCA